MPLHEACQNVASVEVIDLILGHYPRAAFVQDQRKRTPLHHAVQAACVHGTAGSDVVLKLAIAAPETIDVKDENGDTPVDLMIRHGTRTSGSVANCLNVLAASGRITLSMHGSSSPDRVNDSPVSRREMRSRLGGDTMGYRASCVSKRGTLGKLT